MSRLKILVVSPADACRGPLLKAWLNHILGEYAFVQSCGQYSLGINPSASAAAVRAGLERPQETRKTLADFAHSEFDIQIWIGDHLSSAHSQLRAPRLLLTTNFTDLSNATGDLVQLVPVFDTLCAEIRDWTYHLLEDHKWFESLQNQAPN